jgi:hypothetical protein
VGGSYRDGKDLADDLIDDGDNRDIQRRDLRDEIVDLVHLEPPFKNNQDDPVFFAEQDGSRLAAAEVYQELVEREGKVSQSTQAFRTFLGEI